MTRGGDLDRLGVVISIHALREEGDAVEQGQLPAVDISIHALREEGDYIDTSRLPQTYTISIHALREEGDSLPFRAYAKIWNISIHALREEGDSSHKVTLPPPNVFLSTPSARRATRRFTCSGRE